MAAYLSVLTAPCVAGASEAAAPVDARGPDCPHPLQQGGCSTMGVDPCASVTDVVAAGEPSFAKKAHGADLPLPGPAGYLTPVALVPGSLWRRDATDRFPRGRVPLNISYCVYLK